jgi:hypothetical protein
MRKGCKRKSFFAQQEKIEVTAQFGPRRMRPENYFHFFQK